MIHSPEQHGHNIKRRSAMIAIVALGALLVYALRGFQGGILGALIIYTLFLPLHKKFVNKIKMRKSLSATLIMIISSIVILIPIVATVLVVSNSVISYVDKVERRGGISESMPDLASVFIDTDRELFNGVKVGDITSQIELGPIAENVAKTAQNFAVSAASGISNLGLQILVMFFILFYLLKDTDELTRVFYNYSPFNNKNSKRLLTEFRNTTYAGVLGTGLNAVAQGFVLWIGLWIFGFPEPVFWGFIGGILSFVPVVGPALVWAPAGVIALLQNDYLPGVLLWGGLLVSLIDNALRLVVNSKMGHIHPLVSLLGIFIGLPLFGILGLVIGPVLLSFFILAVKMYRDEFLTDKKSFKDGV